MVLGSNLPSLVTLTVQREPHPSRSEVVAPSIHRKGNQAVRHMTQLSRQARMRQPTKIDKLIIIHWVDGLEKDLLVLRTRNWRTLAGRRLAWKRLLEKAKAHPGLSCQ
ncbi:hypothetical protein TNCV_1524231 [Trichonephila clavipes]|nr:hypothetical protein TNCV_1524231 [Trichonephila clavipes]